MWMQRVPTNGAGMPVPKSQVTQTINMFARIFWCTKFLYFGVPNFCIRVFVTFPQWCSLIGDYGTIQSGTVSQWLQDASYSFFDNWYKSKQASLDNGGNGAALWDSDYVLTGLPLGSITKVGIAFHTTSATDLVTICGALIPACLFV